jgi:tetratricopeptide (TPR) repeat protein
MLRGRIYTGLALVVAGCAIPSEERLKDYNEDGVLLYQRGNYKEAAESFQAALGIKPGDAALRFNLGECYDRLGDVAGAEQQYHQCLAQTPDHEACNHALLVLLVRTGRRPEAERWVQDWLSRRPRLAAPYAEDGWLIRLTGDLPRAQTRLQQGLELDPHNVRALTEMALVYEDLQRPDRALVLYERILQRDPKQVDICNRVNLLLAKGAKPPHPE